MAFDYLSRDHQITTAIELLLELLAAYVNELDSEVRLASLGDCRYNPETFGAYGNEAHSKVEELSRWTSTEAV